MRDNRRLVMRIAVVSGVGVASLVVLLVLLPDKSVAWMGAAAAAGVAALGRRLGDVLGALVGRRVEAHKLDVTDPLVIDVKLRNVDYVVFEDGTQAEDVPASGHTLQVTATGAYPKPVLLTRLRVEVTSRASRSGTLTRHAAEVPRRSFEVLLDAVPPRLRALGDSDFPYEVKQDESEAFLLKVTTDSGDVTWALWLDWRSGRRSGSVRVDLDGQDFRVAGRLAQLTAK